MGMSPSDVKLLSCDVVEIMSASWLWLSCFFGVSCESVDPHFQEKRALGVLVWTGVDFFFFVACDELRGLGGICTEYEMWPDTVS